MLIADTATQNFKLYLYNTTTPKNEAWRRVRGGGTQVVTGGYPGVVSDEDTEEDEWPRGGRWGRHPEAASSLHALKTVQGVEGRWTVTDADADRAGARMIYSSITPFVHMLRTDDHDSEHTTLDFRAGRHDHFGVRLPRGGANVDLEHPLLGGRERGRRRRLGGQHHGL